MTRRSLLALSALGTMGFGAPVKLSRRVRLEFDRLGPLRIGMSEKEIRATLSGPFKSDKDTAEGDCYYLSYGDSGLELMIHDSLLARIDVNSPPWRTAAGAGIGSTEAHIRRTYGRDLRVAPHPYDDTGGKYMIVTPRAASLSKFQLLFETTDSKVSSFRAGREDAVRLIEGCQ